MCTHAAKLPQAHMNWLPLLACQLGLSLLFGMPGSSHVDNQSHAKLMLLQPFHAVFIVVHLLRFRVRCSDDFFSLTAQQRFNSCIIRNLLA